MVRELCRPRHLSHCTSLFPRSPSQRFTDAYAGYTVCAPSRTTLFTGRHSGQFKKYNYPGISLPVNQSSGTLAVLLQQAGYTTAAFGKLAPLDDPAAMGFDIFSGQVNQAACASCGTPPRRTFLS